MSKLSDRQLAANRLNALKSTGPRTPEGKDRSSLNAWKHGITAKRVCLDLESRPEFERHMHDFRYRFQPADGYELRLVDSIAVIHWHMDRLRFMESAILQAEIHRPGITGELSNVCDELLPAVAFRYLCDHGNFTTLINSQLNRLSREHARLHDTFLKMRREHPPITPALSDPDDIAPPQENPSQEQYPQNEPGEMRPAAISNIRSIAYKAMPLEPALTRAA